MMKIYNYHYESKEFICESDADESPLEPGVFHIPANATAVPPIDYKEKFARIFDGDNWIYVEDHRGETWWDESGKEVVIDKIGTDILADLLSVAPPPPEPPPPLTLEQKLTYIGLDVDELKTLLGLNNAT